MGATTAAPSGIDSNDPLREAAWGCGRLRERLGAGRVSVWVLNVASQTVSPAVADANSRYDAHVPYERWMRTPLASFPVLRQVLDEDAGQVVDDARHDDRFPPGVVRDFGVTSARLEPLVADRPVGVLSIEPAGRPLSDDERDLVRLLALSVGHAGARREAERQREQAELLLELTEAATSVQSLPETLGVICERLARYARMPRACLFLHRDGQLVPTMARYADGHQDLAEWEQFRTTRHPFRLGEEVLATGRSQIAEDAASPLVRGWWADTFRFRAVLGVPVGAAPRVSGVLTLDDTTPRSFSPELVRLVAAAGAHLDGIIARARAREERTWHVRTLDAVRDLLQQGAHATSVSETGEVVARVAARAFAGERALFVRQQHGSILDVVPIGYDLDTSQQLREALVGGPVDVHPAWADCVRDRRPVLAERGDHPAVPVELADLLPSSASAVLPLESAGEAVGVVHVDHDRPHLRQYHATLAAQLSLEAQLVVDSAVLREKEQQRLADLAHHATHDPLTGLPNRALFEDRLDQALRQMARTPHRVAVLFVDIDRFKRINDRIGHTLADDLLCEVARRLTGCVRDEDTVARFAGDEFVVLLPHVDGVEDAERVAERMTASLATPIAVGEVEVFVSASIGIANGGPSNPDGFDGTHLLRAADAAMFRVKRTGRGRHVVYDPDLDVLNEGMLGLEADLHYALERGELTLRYQPIVDLAHQVAVGFEVLLRWEHPERGTIPPLDFIPLAEATGTIHAIGRWVIQRACQQLAAWQAARPERDLFISVNLSPLQVHDPTLLGHVRHALDEAGVDPGALVLEITESSLVHEEEGLPTLARLHDLGVRIAIDDFGIGYSALSYLQRFPIDVLKVDKSFVSSLGQGAGEGGLARTVVAIARTLDTPAIAEGIEDATQLAELQELGSQMGQGFLFAPPLRASQAETWLAPVAP